MPTKPPMPDQTPVTAEKFFSVRVEVTYEVPYVVKAETESEAEKVALERAHDGLGMLNAEIVNATVIDCVDETEEHA